MINESTILKILIALLIISFGTIFLSGSRSITNAALTTANNQVTEIRVPYVFTSRTWGEWLALERAIQTAPTHTVVLLWQGMGGRVDLGISFGAFLSHVNKYVIIKIVGPSASMHAISACYGNKTIVTSNGFLMFHLREEDGYPDLSQDSKNENTHLMGYCLAKGLVTNHDIQIVNSDKELYIFPDGSRQVQEDRRRK